ncbi:MAG TPA: nuclear transport factor 2 family protein [Novosphingobium sp.]|nr:nuclear transport factor 2 family protein [Novosphingobium sp.]
MNEQLQELVDRMEIQKLIAIYCQGCDRYDAVRMAEPFHPDSIVDHGHTHAPAGEFVSEALPAQREHCSMVWHQMGQSLIEVNGEEAKAESYMLVAIRGSGDDDKRLDLMGGRLVDTFVKEAGKWAIKTRLQIRDWSFSTTIEHDQLARAHFAEGQPGANDPGLIALGLLHSGRLTVDH